MKNLFSGVFCVVVCLNSLAIQRHSIQKNVDCFDLEKLASDVYINNSIFETASSIHNIYH